MTGESLLQGGTLLVGIWYKDLLFIESTTCLFLKLQKESTTKLGIDSTDDTLYADIQKKCEDY